MPISKILVPDDFSEHSGFALEYAVGLAQRFGAQIELAHAYGAPVATLSPYGSVFPADLLQGLRDAAREKIDRSQDRVRAAGVEATARLSKRTPQEALPLIAGDSQVDLIVMGTRGFGGIKQVLLGSVAQHLVRYAPCPVMTVATARDDAGPLEFRRILLPTDFSTAMEPTLELAKVLAGAGDGAEIVVANAIHVPREVQPYLEGSSDSPTQGVVSEPIQARVDEVAEALRGEGYRATGKLLAGRAEEAVVRAIGELDIDLIVMGTHGRSGISQLLLGSVAERVLRTAECPTATVKPA